ncbi:charged multivesicular body protein 2a-like [Mytilus trossulus]|uniref:charged multivesicular body protein 2a-like n=1 Tax=Mytilus trossulus TaxID=6551 RepID=UPI003003E122
MDAVKIVVKDLVLTRRYVKKTFVMKAKLKSVSLHIGSLLSNDSMVIAMRGLGKTMQSMDTQLMLTHLKKIIVVFEQQFKMKEKEEESINEDDEDEMNVRCTINRGNISRWRNKAPQANATGGRPNDAKPNLEA